jgi:Na+/proline symporter
MSLAVFPTLAVSFKLSADFILFTVFLLLNLIIGLHAGLKVRSTYDFAIGNKGFSTSALTATVVATFIGGGFMLRNLEDIYTDGLKAVLMLLGRPLSLLVIACLARRMGEFLQYVSVAEAMGNLYGGIVRAITAVSGVLLGVTYTAIQLQVINRILEMLFGLEGSFTTLMSAGIVIFYSTFGGIRSVTITDIFQFITFSIFIPILGLIIWNHIKEPQQVVHTLTTNPNFSLYQTIGSPTKSIGLLASLLFWMVPAMQPVTFQRIAMAKDLQQVKQSNLFAFGIVFLMAITLAWISILLVSINPRLEASKLLPYMVKEYAYIGLKGLVGIGITAMAMSTADSHLNASTVLVIHDIVGRFNKNWKESIHWLRLCSFLLGCLALALAFYIKGILPLLILGASFYIPVVTVPLLLAVLGFRSTSIAALIGILFGCLTTAFGEILLGDMGINIVVAGMFANLIFFMGSHYLLRQPGGWVGIKEKLYALPRRQARKEALKAMLSGFTAKKIYAYLQKNLPIHDISYFLFGLYVLGATYSLFFTIPEAAVVRYNKLYEIASHSVLICATGFLTYPAWPPTFRARWFITYAWLLGICYTLFFVGTQLVLMSGFHGIQLMIFLLNCIIAATLLAWPVTLTLAASGILLGITTFNLAYGPVYLDGVLASLQFNFIYVVLLISSFLIVVFRLKKSKEAAERENSYLEANYEEKKDELMQILSYKEQALKELDPAETKLFNQLTLDYVKQIIYRITDYIRLSVTELSLEALLQEVKELVKHKRLDASLFIQHNTTIKNIWADRGRIKQLLVNAVEMIAQHNPLHAPIRIILEEATLGYQLDYIKDYTKEIRAIKFTLTSQDKLPESQEIYPVQDHFSYLESGKQVYGPSILENVRIISAHYGHAALVGEDTHIYVIPINVKEVRSSVMETLREPTKAIPEELAHPVAVSLEAELFDKLKSTHIDQKVIHQALDVIKKYHAGARRKSGEPFFTHPIAVALILLTYCQDQDAVIAALLHDTIEDTSFSPIHIKALFGDTVAFLVGKVTNLEDNLRKLKLEDHENTKRILDYGDKRAAYVKLADRLHNMRTIQWHSSIQRQKHIAHETFLLFVPMAKELRLANLAEELEARSLAVLGKKG